MFHEFLALHRSDIIARPRAKVATRNAPNPPAAELEHGATLFPAQLTDTLRREQETAERPTSGEMCPVFTIEQHPALPVA